MLGLTRYQWIVLIAAWLGWGFDVFDGILFNYVAPNCVPTLLGLPIGSPSAEAATLYWTGVLTSVLLLGWAVGGVIFGKLADRFGRTKILVLTILLYSVGTASCAFANDMWFLVLCRVFTSLGVGGEWAAGAAMVAEVMPEKSRLEAGAFLYTSGAVGSLLATLVNFLIAGVFFLESPATSWRYVFLCGLIPAGLALILRLFVKEPETWQKIAAEVAPPRIRELFNPENLPATISGFFLASIALMTLWCCNAFIPTVATALAQSVAPDRGLDATATLYLAEEWKAIAMNCFFLGSFIGTLLTVPIAKHLGRKSMFFLYFLFSTAILAIDFGLPISPEVRLYLYCPIGLSVSGVMGSFGYYLTELFPTRLRATGSGFCYNAGRIVAASGPFLVGYIVSQGENALSSAATSLLWVALIPFVGMLFVPLAIETKGQVLAE